MFVTPTSLSRAKQHFSGNFYIRIKEYPNQIYEFTHNSEAFCFYLCTTVYVHCTRYHLIIFKRYSSLHAKTKPRLDARVSTKQFFRENNERKLKQPRCWFRKKRPRSLEGTTLKVFGTYDQFSLVFVFLFANKVTTNIENFVIFR